jgi:rubrerythrin
MEISDYQFDRAKFDAVWQRVLTGKTESAPKTEQTAKRRGDGEAEKLRCFMDGEAGDAQFYWSLAAMCSAGARATLLRISCDERRHLKKLRARYFILTGGTYAPPDTCPLIYTVPDALRRKYAGEKEGSAAYTAAAESAADADLRDTYLALAQDEARHSRTIGCIIESMM